MNFAPKGEIGALLIETAEGLVQVNIPGELREQAPGLVGQEVALRTGPEPKVEDHPRGDHPVRKFKAFAGDGAEASAGSTAGAKPPKPRPWAAGTFEVAGTVARLNYAKHGEANGVVLDSGDFVHLKPEGMKQTGLKVGQSVTARGGGTTSDVGTRAIEAEEVNGTKLHHKKPH